ncbi:hypothetical protein HO173_010970 [Letharia columbiana]|uniref:Amine oxidase domain-containing protein n=1 Tax=Letharia columbiana TaxID=112416 RepID=A0A8H6FLR7_9LECA|nr:uncharacterized protein HO173_010970 [Letharia columbiana]KAF6230854.1 hypothetical protein HO173_010970 [Letharia columbiana]
MNWAKDEKGDLFVDVTINGEDSPRHHDAIFNAAPLGAMQRVDLSGLNLNRGTNQAIRSLGHGASCKVGIRFKIILWIKHSGNDAKTDLPLRICVHPSYNPHDHNPNDDTEKPSILPCSHTRSQEAQRAASPINRSRISPERRGADDTLDRQPRQTALRGPTTTKSSPTPTEDATRTTGTPMPAPRARSRTSVPSLSATCTRGSRAAVGRT